MNQPTYLLALDQGTSSSRALVFRDDGRVHSQAQQEFPQIFPQPGWVEHEPMAIWDSQLATAREALRLGGLRPQDIRAVGITNQRETTLLWNRRTGQPLHNAIVWQDRRTEPLCTRLRDEGRADEIRASTGLVIGNLNAMAMEPVGHIAGMAASVMGALATVVAVVLAVPVGLAFDGTPLPLMAGIAAFSVIGWGVMRTMQR